MDSKIEIKTIELLAMDTSKIAVPQWATPCYKIKRALEDGKLHATNHFFSEEKNPDWPFGVNSWSINPYTIDRPGAFYAWVAGFCEQWGELVRQEIAAIHRGNIS